MTITLETAKKCGISKYQLLAAQARIIYIRFVKKKKSLETKKHYQHPLDFLCSFTQTLKGMKYHFTLIDIIFAYTQHGFLINYLKLMIQTCIESGIIFQTKPSVVLDAFFVFSVACTLQQHKQTRETLSVFPFN